MKGEKKRFLLPLALLIAVALAMWGGRCLTVAIGTDVYGESQTGAFDNFAPSAADTEPPAPITGLTVTDPGTGTSLILRWNANTEPDLLGYRIYRATSADASVPPPDGAYQRLGNAMIDTQVPEYTDNTVTRDVYCFYRITAVDQSGNESAYVAPGSTLAADLSPPAVPQGLKAKELDSGEEIILEWQPNAEPDLSGYQLYRATDAAGPFELLKTLDRRETTYHEKGLVQGQWYYYYLKAVDEAGNCSDQTPVVSARPRQAVWVGFEQEDAKMPAYLFMKTDCSAMFLNIPGDRILVQVRALDENGAEIPLSGTFRFAAAFGRFKNPEVTGNGSAEATFTAQEIGGGEIAVEYYPPGAEEPALVDSCNVRALFWRISLTASGDQTITGASDISLVARVTDQNDRPVTDWEAKVVFETAVSPDPLKDLFKKETPKKRRRGNWQGPAHANVVENGRRSGTALGHPGPTGEVRAQWVASTAPGTTRVRAVLYYDDLRGEEPRPKLVDISNTQTVEVIPGPARYVGFDPETISLDGKHPQRVTVQVFDAFGNPTADYGDDLKVWVQVPPNTPVTFSSDDSDTWCEQGIWLPVDIGEKLRVQSTAADLPDGLCALVTRVEGASLDPPPGVAQVNLPLIVEQD